jgi:hypothetical protein
MLMLSSPRLVPEISARGAAGCGVQTSGAAELGAAKKLHAQSPERMVRTKGLDWGFMSTSSDLDSNPGA